MFFIDRQSHNESLDIVLLYGIQIFKLAHLHIHEYSLKPNYLVKNP